MRIEGYDVKPNENLTFRFANENDRDIDGNQIPNDFVVFVKKKDCKVCEQNGKLYYDIENAPIVPMFYIDSYYGMGEFKTRRAIKGIKVNDQLVYEYKQATLYFAYNGMVYIGSIKNTVND